ncbi:MAG: hypothetical protein LC808_06815 [Actinobacteria bacterium]|nr:hypothetical protein [Actinomycetota bacterium]
MCKSTLDTVGREDYFAPGEISNRSELVEYAISFPMQPCLTALWNNS